MLYDNLTDIIDVMFRLGNDYRPDDLVLVCVECDKYESTPRTQNKSRNHHLIFKVISIVSEQMTERV